MKTTNAPVAPTTSYLDRLVKLIPAEIVAAHLAIQGLVANDISMRNLGIEISAGVLLLILPIYLRRLHGVRTMSRTLLTMVSFVVWVVAVSSPVYTRFDIDPIWGSIALILWTTVVPIFSFAEEDT